MGLNLVPVPRCGYRGKISSNRWDKPGIAHPVFIEIGDKCKKTAINPESGDKSGDKLEKTTINTKKVAINTAIKRHNRKTPCEISGIKKLTLFQPFDIDIDM